MTPQQYERLTELFHAALETSPKDRSAYLNRVSNRDVELRGELESLLAAHAAGADYTEKPLDDIAAGMYLAEQNNATAGTASLPPNTRIDRYEIRSLLGKGGMGEVYLAEDTRLHRKVALKLLPAALGSNQERMRRFEQEATAAAALNHPYIAHIYEIGESEGTHFIVMEHIDGDTLRDKIHRDKVPLTKLLEYLIQVAEGLTKAHDAGIVHRDLKPDNIMITPDDYAKILDFGLAKLVERRGDGEKGRRGEENETLIAASPRPPVPVSPLPSVASFATSPGLVMGTAGYMSPEQAEGKLDQIDHRSDIFSFGCILFEAVTGQRPFADDSIIKLLHKVVYEAAPSIADFTPAAPADLRRVIRRCLAKDRAERYQTIKDVAVELREIRHLIVAAGEIDSVEVSDSAQTLGRQMTQPLTRSTSSAEYIAGSISQHKKAVIAVAALGAIAIAAVIWLLPRSGSKKPTSLPAVTLKRLTPDIHAVNPTLSPDGKYLAYGKKEKGLWSLWLKDLASGNAVQTMPPDLRGYFGFQFTPDSKQIYYETTGRDSPNGIIRRIPLNGGTPQDIATNSWGHFALSPDGKQLVLVRDHTLVITDAEGKGERDLMTLTSGREHFVIWGSQLSWSHDGTRIVVCAWRDEPAGAHSELMEVSVSDGTRRILPTPAWTFIEDVAWLAEDSSVLVTARDKQGESFQVWRVTFPGGETTRVTNDSNSYEGLSLTTDSRTLVVEQAFSRQNIWLASLSDTRNAKQLTTSTIAADGYFGIAFAPDDKIIFTSPRSGNVDLWRMNADGTNQKPLTANAGDLNRRPIVTPDGRYIVFISTRTGTAHIWRMDIDGQNAIRLTDSAKSEDSPNLSADGQWIYYSTSVEEKPQIMKVSINGGDAVRVPINVDGTISTWDAVPSPDGKLLAYGVYVEKAVQPWKIAIVSSEGGQPLKLLDVSLFRGVKRWTSDSKSLMYINQNTNGEIWQQPIDGRPPTKLFTLSNERLYNFAISPDFQKIAYSLGNESSEAVLISNFGKE